MRGTAPLLQLIHGAASSPVHNKEMSSRISYGGNKTVKSVITQTMNSEPFITYCLSTHQYCLSEETYSTTIKSYSGCFYVASFSSLTAEENHQAFLTHVLWIWTAVTGKPCKVGHFQFWVIPRQFSKSTIRLRYCVKSVSTKLILRRKGG